MKSESLIKVRGLCSWHLGKWKYPHNSESNARHVNNINIALGTALTSDLQKTHLYHINDATINVLLTFKLRVLAYFSTTIMHIQL